MCAGGNGAAPWGALCRDGGEHCWAHEVLLQGQISTRHFIWRSPVSPRGQECSLHKSFDFNRAGTFLHPQESPPAAATLSFPSLNPQIPLLAPRSCRTDRRTHMSRQGCGQQPRHNTYHLNPSSRTSPPSASTPWELQGGGWAHAPTQRHPIYPFSLSQRGQAAQPSVPLLPAALGWSATGSQEPWVRRATRTGLGMQGARGSPARLWGAVQAKRSAVVGRAARGPKKARGWVSPRGFAWKARVVSPTGELRVAAFRHSSPEGRGGSSGERRIR